MTTATVDQIADRAVELAKPGPDRPEDPISALTDAAGGDRSLLEAARDQMAGRVHRSVDDWDATAALTLLNRCLSDLPRYDPLDWKIRWTQRFRRP
jgi:hypothetical protein